MFLRDDQSTVIPKQFLWAVGLDPEIFPPGSVIGSRYRVVESQIVMDTQMYSMPEMPEDLTDLTIKYLKLTRYALHVAVPYSLISTKECGSILILENSPLDEKGQLRPTLHQSWATATPMRQINWLWQILKLWKPLLEQKVLGSLLRPQQLRICGPWVRILELSIDQITPQLSELADLLDSLKDDTHEVLQQPIEILGNQIGEGKLDLAAAINYVDQLAAQQSKKSPPWIRVACSTDSGPRRDHNEDSCYPMQDQPQMDNLRNRVVIICDGLGGHEGGEVASSMAIKTLTRLLHTLLQQVQNDPEPFSAQAFVNQLDKIVRVANDQIVTLNDQQQRLAQQRMGTTLVMIVAPHAGGNPPHEVYVVHVGDSRAYWINKNDYHQVTADDDVATRETVLGYSFFPYSCQRIDGGALIQALGTRPSDVLLPRIQRFMLDEDCLFLLCSDGLSDYERVDYIWENHIRPILNKNIPLESACQNLINQANLLNGHDNATVGLMRCRFGPIDEPQDTEPDRGETITVLQDKTDEDEIADLALEIDAQVDHQEMSGRPLEPLATTFIAETKAGVKKKIPNNLLPILIVLFVLLAGLLWWLAHHRKGGNESPPINPNVQSFQIKYLLSKN